MTKQGKHQNETRFRADIVICTAPVNYSAGCEAQERLVARRARAEIPDTVLFLEHSPVVTLGRSGRTDSLLSSPARLSALGIELVASTRGGDVTYHGPGQIVVYPILNLKDRETDVRSHVRMLEEVALRTAADFQVRAFRLETARGVWTDNGKLAAIGVRVSRSITSHGMSFNVNTDLSGFANIIPCGRRGDRATSLREIMGPPAPSLTDVRRRMCAHMSDVFSLEPVMREVACIRDCDPGKSI